MAKKRDTVEENWQKTWKDIIERPDGSIDVEQLKKELSDFSFMISNTTTIVHDVTGGRVSNPMTMAFEVVDAMKEHQEELEKCFVDDNKANGYCTYCEQDIEESEEDGGGFTPESVLN